MKFKEYQEKAISTALYDSAIKKLLCSAIGMGTELDEYLDAKLDGSRKAKFFEMGDCCWKLAVFTHYIGIDRLKYIPDIEENIFDLPSLHQKFMEKIKKTIRDYDFIIPEKYMDDIIEFVYTYYSILQNEMESEGMDIIDVMTKNLAKLKDRQERNVLSGDGDER